jgi:hypothetical protein
MAATCATFSCRLRIVNKNRTMPAIAGDCLAFWHSTSMLVVSTLLSISDHLWIYLACLFFAGAFSMALNYFFLGKYVSGLIFLQTSFVFNTAIVLFGSVTGAISCFRVAHFFLYELTVVIGVYWVYRRILRHRVLILKQLQRLNAATIAAVLVMFNFVMFGLYVIFVIDGGGSSRIEFMTASWFSYFRPAMSVLGPLSFFFPIYLLDHRRRFLPLSIIAAVVVSSIASGSKGALVFGLISAWLLYEELKGARLVIPKALRGFLLIAISLSALFALQRLDVSLPELAQRFVRFGESTIMVYYAEDPATAAAGVSTIAKIHRGAAKLLGDSSAADVDTLFGFALSREDNGAHNFTGPNAQVSSYMLSNYSGWQNLIGFASVFGYLAVVTWFVEHFMHRQIAACTLILPFIVASLNDFIQDYYQGMSDVTLMVMLALALIGMGVTILACRNASQSTNRLAKRSAAQIAKRMHAAV